MFPLGVSHQMFFFADDLLPDPVGTSSRPIVGSGVSDSGGNGDVGISMVQNVCDGFPPLFLNWFGI